MIKGWLKDMTDYEDRAKEFSIAVDIGLLDTTKKQISEIVVFYIEQQITKAYVDKIDADKVQCRTWMQKVRESMRELGVDADTINATILKAYRTAISRL